MAFIFKIYRRDDPTGDLIRMHGAVRLDGSNCPRWRLIFDTSKVAGGNVPDPEIEDDEEVAKNDDKNFKLFLLCGQCKKEFPMGQIEYDWRKQTMKVPIPRCSCSQNDKFMTKREHIERLQETVSEMQRFGTIEGAPGGPSTASCAMCYGNGYKEGQANVDFDRGRLLDRLRGEALESWRSADCEDTCEICERCEDKIIEDSKDYHCDNCDRCDWCDRCDSCEELADREEEGRSAGYDDGYETAKDEFDNTDEVDELESTIDELKDELERVKEKYEKRTGDLYTDG